MWRNAARNARENLMSKIFNNTQHKCRKLIIETIFEDGGEMLY